MKEEQLFHQALEQPADRRSEFLDAACGEDTGLRQRVEALLEAHENPGSFLQPPPQDSAPTIDQPITEKSGTVIGRYKLLEQIGEGGFGVVFMAKQKEPVRRKVALKIIKPGMDTKEVIARFQAERQALAIMDHPNIAKVLDAGTTDSGRPYFVMELIKGIQITEYCDKHHLATRQRLSLLMDICHAIQHAHQKGVIHRDIKPSNVLITLQDGQPIAKVIDFGVSKAINQQLTEKTLFTAFGQMVGTPQYMSPEQAEMSGLDIDTRSDIYSLGVLMYELMTGTTPLDGKRLRSLGYAEMQRVIREEEPPRPSNRISTLGQAATSAAEHRSVNAKRLRDQLAGELDWIVMKALDKDRGGRYETANALASDIDRYLHNESVEACPPSAAYRLRKFAARNKMLVRTAAAIALLLVAVIAINTALVAWAGRSERLSEERLTRELQLRTAAVRSRQGETKQRRQVEIERDRAKAAETQTVGQREAAQAAEQRAQSNFQQARLAVDQYLQTVSESELLLRPGMSPLRRQLLESARTFYQTFLDQQTSEVPQTDTATARYRMGRILEEQGDRARARAEYQSVRPGYEQLVAQSPDDHSLRLELVDLCHRLGDLKAAQHQCEAVLEADPTHTAARRTLAFVHEAAAQQLVSAQQPAEALGRYAEAEQIRAALASGDEPTASDLADLAQTHYATAQVLLRQQQREHALKKYLSGVVAAERARDLDPHTPRYGQLVASGLRQRARTERAPQQTDESLRSYQRAESAWSKLVFEFPAYAEFKAELAQTRLVLADCQRTLGRAQDAASTEFRLEQFLSQQPRTLPHDHYQLAVIFAQLARVAAAGEAELSEAALVTLPGYAEKGIEQLTLAVTQGYRGESGLDQDPLLQPLSERVDFRSVLAESQKKVAAAPGGPASSFSTDLPHQLLMIASLRGIAAAHRSLGQLDAARTTLQQCQTDLDQLPLGDAATATSVLAERGKTMYALGRLHWESRRYGEAKQAWDRGFAFLGQAHDQAGDETKQELARTIAIEEWQLIIVFGEIAFWGEAARHRANYVKFGPYMSEMWEGRIARIALVANEGKHYEDVCRYLVERFGDSSRLDVLFVLAQGEHGLLAPEKLVELAQQNVTSATPSGFIRSVLGACQLHNGNAQEAILNLEFWLHFHRAQALFQIGDHAAAKFWLELGERQYASSSRIWLASSILKSPDAQYYNWWEQAVQQAARQEAWQLIEGRAVPDPWARLFEARGYGLVGDATKSEAAFAEALNPVPEDPQVWLASAETRAVLGQHDQAEPLFAKALELAPEDPKAWIARGKYYLERGLDAQADADMMRAAEFAKDDLDVFIRSGWWAVGPYPADINKSFPPEDSPHPSRPVARAADDPQKNLSPRHWIRVPVDNATKQGLTARVHFDGHLTDFAKNASVYTLAHVYSPEARTATLCFGSGYMWAENKPQHQARMRIWVNGETVVDWTQCPKMHVALQRVPVQLKAGRNEILVRVSSPDGHNFRLRLGDSPVSQALLAARLGQWHRAVDAFQRTPLLELVQGGYGLPSVYCGCLAAVNDTEQYEQAVAKAFAYGAHTHDREILGRLLSQGTLRSNSTMSRDVLLKIVKDLEEPTKSWVRGWKGRALFRAQEHKQAIDWHKTHNMLGKLGARCVLAMAHHELGQEAEANDLLQKAKDAVFSQMADRRASDYEGHALLVEAHQRISGVPLADDPAWVSLRKEIDSQLAQMPPETSDYDLALMLDPKLPRLWVARARRYAELSRWEDAERDFAKAISLDKNNSRNWLASARYWNQRNDLDKVHDAYDQVLRLGRGSSYRSEGVEDLQYNEPVFLALLQTHDRDPALWEARGLQLCEAKRWADAVQVWQHRLKLGESNPALMYQLALLQLATGDTSGYASTCAELIDRYAQDEIGPTSYLAAWACILAPRACEDYAPLLDLAQRSRDRSLVSSSHRVTLGAALFRAGRCEEAIAELEEGALLADDDDDPYASPPAYAWYLLAMAHSELGNQDTARQWYEQAQHWTREQLESQSARVAMWNRPLTLELMERESAERLGGASAPSGTDLTE